MNETTPSSNVETEYLEINSKNAWMVLFQFIRNECSNYDFTCNESKKPENRSLNRYRDVMPYDHTRIVLKKGQTDYINANLLQMDKANRQYILTQGPLPNTAGHFWLMVWEQNSKAIIMLNKVIEKHLTKCHQYWPLAESSDHVMKFPDLDLEVEYITKINKSDYTTTTLRLKNTETNESRDILHFNYTTWPDFGVPKSPTAFLRFLADVRESGVLDKNVGPSIVHCSAGIGRSGTFCLVDTCLVLIEENGLNSVNVRDILLEMRKSRMGLIQMPDQLRFSYAAIIEGAKHLPLSTLTLGNNDVITNNHCENANNISNSSIDEDDEPPPLPPPRGESLTRSCMITETALKIENNANTVSNLPNKPLPCEPPGGVNSNNIGNHVNDISGSNASSDGDENSFQPNSPPSSPESKNELRRRRLEKKERMEAQVRDMKRRQKESEDWQKFKRSIFSPLSLGLVAAIVGGICGYLYFRD
ncbi:tyrosine-protein phosphatase non-receptor type 2 [Phymastichus coffea]|uniref:tyrosine-protein phosphatase non-receptor type 2 n=1 Tax=Phymastichus coffea TaxID=108790 RepID=UPI00273AEA09|nr:tyrosine-protein phosphatase non-receptor type 2 [Phymastichus coffea]